MFSHATTGPPKLVPWTIYGSYSWYPQTICDTADGPPRPTMAPWLVPLCHIWSAI